MELIHYPKICWASDFFLQMVEVSELLHIIWYIKKYIFQRSLKQGNLYMYKMSNFDYPILNYINCFVIFQLYNFDPFLLLDDFRVKAPAGFPDHPHRGFETVWSIIFSSSENYILRHKCKKNYSTTHCHFYQRE